MSGTAETDGEELQYLDPCPDMLPANKPKGYPHLIKELDLLSTLDTTKLRLADGVATVLYNYNPEFLRKFLDLSIYRVMFHSRQSFNPDHLPYWVLERKGNNVTCYSYRPLIQSDYIIRVRNTAFSYTIQDAGNWTPWHVWAKDFEWSGTNGTSTIEGLGGLHAEWLIRKKMWRTVQDKYGQVETEIEEERGSTIQKTVKWWDGAASSSGPSPLRGGRD